MNTPRRVFLESISLHRTKGFGDAFVHVGVRIEGDDLAALWNEVYKTLERRFDCIQICIYVSMIELDRGENHGVGKVMQKLWPLVEEGAVILIALDDEMLRLAQREAGAKILRDAPDQK